MSGYYLEDGDTVRKVSFEEVLRWCVEHNDGHITNNLARDTFKVDEEEVTVSTVFLCMDHGWGNVPILWETMIFGGKYDQWQSRYTSKATALKGHEKAVLMVKGLIEE